jgi:hypothetical protein
MVDPDFVGRADLVAQILGEAGGPGRTGMFFDIGGIPGIGKTRLLDQLAKLTRPEDAVVRINGSDFEARGSRKRTATSDEDAELRQFRILLRGALESLPDDDQITDVLNYLTDYSPSTQRAQRADFVHDPDEVLERATGAANDLGRTLAASQARFLVLVDDFHFLAGRPLGQWVITWLAGVRGADVVVTHEDFSGAEDPGLPSRAVRLPLGNLSYGDVEAYLKSHPDIGPDVAGIVDHVWDFTGGYPRALVLVADLIKGSGSRDNAVQLIGQLAALQGGRAAQLEALVNRILDMIDDEELRDTLYRVCVARHFDGPLIERLMHVDESRAQTLINRLMHYSFVRKSTGGHSFLAVSDFVRRSGENRLGVAQTQVTHSLAADYYQALIVRAVDEDETSYQSWFRYEQPTFQALERDWLYHLSRLTESNRRAGRIGIARIFLDAFWWWGSYIPFPFCEQILADWTDATSADDEDRAWGAQLRIVYDSYPKGWRKADTPPEEWKTVRRELRYLWHLAAFDQAHPDDQEMQHIGGILDIYLADAARYVDPGDPEADERLDDAADRFSANDDEWDLAWVEFYRADLAVSREQADLAISIAKESADRHPDLDDDELVANLHRVCADAQWLRQDPRAALDADARAVLHAYKFQVKDVQDDYTDAFQQEMIERSMERMAALHADRNTGHTVLRSACARIRAFFGPYWREVGAGPLADVGLDVIRALDEGRLDDVAGVLFPARPTVLGYHGTPYAKTCVEVTHQMKRELVKPPGTPLPPAGT